MPIVKKNQLLVTTFKIPRKLHDELDQIKELAKKKGLEYDPTEALTKALQKDIDSAKLELDLEIKEQERKPQNHIDK